MKTLDVAITLGWWTQIEVPDDFDVSAKSLKELFWKHHRDFDYQDGSLSATEIGGWFADDPHNGASSEI